MPDVLGGKATGLPYDVMTEQARLARKRKLVEALQAQAMGTSSPTVNTGRYVVPNFADPIARYMAYRDSTSMGKDLYDQEAKVAREMNTQRQASVQDLIQSFMGYKADRPDMTLAGMGGSNDPNADLSAGQPNPGGLDMQDMPRKTEDVAPDPVGGVIRAVGSSQPGIQEMGLKAWDAMSKSKAGMAPDFKTLLEHSKDLDAKARAKFFNKYGYPDIDESFFDPKGEVKIAGNVAVGTKGANVVSRTATEHFGDPRINPITGLPEFKSLDTNRTFPMTGGNVTQESTARKQIGEQTAKKAAEGYDKANESLASLKNISQARQELQTKVNPALLGAGSDIKLGLIKAAGAMGLSVPSTASVETLNSLMGNLMIEKIRALAPVTKDDIDEMKRIIGSSSNTYEALNQMLDLAERRSGQVISTHNKFVEGAIKEPGGEAYKKYYLGDPEGAAEIGRAEPTETPPPPAFENLSPDVVKRMQDRYDELKKKYKTGG